MMLRGARLSVQVGLVGLSLGLFAKTSPRCAYW
jgi:hypothetical protein